MHLHPFFCIRCKAVLLSGQPGAVVRIYRVPRRREQQRFFLCVECLDRVIEAMHTRPELEAIEPTGPGA
jgi:hypothetical protein